MQYISWRFGRMPKWLRVLMLFPLMLLPQAFALTPDKIAEKAIPSVVLIKAGDGLGTGFLVSSDGMIATNLHVVGAARSATIVLADGREFSNIEVVAHDEAHDLLVLRIPLKNLVPLALGDSNKVKVGERVIAIGHPLGLGNTVSDGLVSAIRKVNSQLTMLQISAPISQGSSGGPLFNEAGEVIGISTRTYLQGQNLNFGMPINQLKPLLRPGPGTPLAAWKTPVKKYQRNVPSHDSKLLSGCTDDQLRQIQGSIEEAINLGAPLYNNGNHEACYRIYASAAHEINRKIPACNGPKRALLEGVERSGGLSNATDKAWAMRDAFDGVLGIIARTGKGKAQSAGNGKAKIERHVPYHALSLFDGCSNEQVRFIGEALVGAINVGAPLYNQGNIEACYRVYEGAIFDISRQASSCQGPNNALSSGMREAANRASYTDKAWALRDAFDGVLDALQRRAK